MNHNLDPIYSQINIRRTNHFCKKEYLVFLQNNTLYATFYILLPIQNVILNFPSSYS